MSDLDKIWKELSPRLSLANEMWLSSVELKKQATEKQEVAFREINLVIQEVSGELTNMGAVEVDIQLWVDTKPGNNDKILGLRVFCALAEKGPVTIELEL